MEARRSARYEIAALSRYRSGVGVKRNVTVLDVSETGCKFFDRRSILRVGHCLTLRIEELGPFDATVRWIEQDIVGVQFTHPIYPPIFEHICKTMGNADWRPRP